MRTLLYADFVLALTAAAFGQSDTPGTGLVLENANTGASITEGSQSTKSMLTAVHAKFEKLQGPFAVASDVAKVCLTCHTEAGQQVTQSIHRIWETHNLIPVIGYYA